VVVIKSDMIDSRCYALAVAWRESLFGDHLGRRRNGSSRDLTADRIGPH
jgi:hypothetical protein